MRWADIACLPMVLQRALAGKFQIVARSRHPICLNGPFKGAPIQRLGTAAQTGFAGVGCKLFQCFAASTGSALSGRRTITIAPPQAQRQTGRSGEVGVGGGAADGRRCNTCSRRKLRRLLCVFARCGAQRPRVLVAHQGEAGQDAGQPTECTRWCPVT